MQTSTQSQELKFALDMVRRAGEICMKYFNPDIAVVMKADNTPVTAADKECERFIREQLAQKFPDDNIHGEEEGLSEIKLASGKKATRTWIIDPIDGTYNFARNLPVFSTLLALEDQGEIVLGIVHAPAMEETYWAEKGRGAFRNGESIQVSKVSKLNEAQFEFGSPARISDKGYWDAMKQVLAATYRQRGFGDYLTFAHVFRGQAEAGLEVGVQPWDLAPMKIIVEEAGGRFSDLQGGSSIYTGDCLVSNGILHDQFLKFFQK